MSRVTSSTPVLLFKRKSLHPGKPSVPCRLGWLVILVVRHQKGNQVRGGVARCPQLAGCRPGERVGGLWGRPTCSCPTRSTSPALASLGSSADRCVRNLKAGHGFMISLTLSFWLVCFLASCLPPAECGPLTTAAYLPPWLSPQCLPRAGSTVGAL